MIRLGRWQDALSGVKEVNALVFDAPYSAKTHASEAVRGDGVEADGLAPDYESFGKRDVAEFCASWRLRNRGWWVSITDSELIPVWQRAFTKIGLYAFAPVPCIINGMTCRMSGDGPSSWALYAIVARPKRAPFSKWGTLPGAYVGPRQPGAGGGRGKPSWLMNALVRDYTRKGDLVCDPFAGWGATEAAALGLDRRSVGSEMNAEAHAEALHRLRKPQQRDLFA